MHIVTTHTEADLDGLASILAAVRLFPDAVAAFSGSCDHNVHDFLGSGYLNLKVLSPQEVDREKVTTLTLVDTRIASRINRFSTCLNNPGLTLNIFDHHPDTPSDLHGNFEIIRECGATTTLLTELLHKRGVSLSVEDATTLTLGIYKDTGGLRNRSTTPADLRAAAWLLEQGAQLDVVSHYLSHELNSAQVKILHELLSNARRYTIQNVPVVIATSACDYYVDNCSLVVRRLLEMENLNAIFALISMAGRIHLIARSRTPDINTAEVAADFGGGGHAMAASATISDITLIQAQEKLVRVLHAHIRPAAVAEEMMTSPAITVSPNDTIDTAQRILVRYNITAAPVLSGQETVGIITRQILERASQHHLGGRPVSDYMSSEFATLGINATLGDIQGLIIENRQRIIPILNNGKGLLGIITRTDLLNRLVDNPALSPKKLHGPESNNALEGNLRNLNEIIIGGLSRSMIRLLLDIGELADTLKCRAYAVGGFVRDLLLHSPNFDLDIVVEGDGIEFAHQLSLRTGGRCSIHERFKTAVVLLPPKMSQNLPGTHKDGSFKVDIATARLEYYDSPAAMPTVELSSIKLDLYRRDFTINAMALQLNPARFGELIDFFHSQSDLRKKAIKTLHNLSFVEDPSRIFRAIRFEKRMDFTISPHTRHLIRNAVEMGFFGKTNDTRYATELKIILEEDNPLPALERLGEFDLYCFIWPDLKPYCRIDRHFRHILCMARETISWHSLLFRKEACCRWQVYLLVIMSRSPLPILGSYCDRFSESPKNREFLLTQKELMDSRVNRLRECRDLKNSDIVRILDGIEIEGLLAMRAVTRKSRVLEAISFYIRDLRWVRPLLNGNDLIALGLKPGPGFKKVLDTLTIARLDGLTSTPNDEEELVRRQFLPPLS
ncbi:CBS domain-containing protein [Desulforhopalus vacuolatus]|uniref:CBS domain-containing protein n=1 Tax=Desulforhopalus vacuolatus TaxID=40414 RepID=UPI001964D1B0|nr:CBS domain-containing protein [Desulforhopalus vacuolatus]MBM9520457.1 CBS domain-containing protein [Desulforhopalus vacuolatus]